MHLFLNGRFVPRDEARVSVFDAGLQHAVGLFETLGARNGQVFRPRFHVERLIESARTLGLSESLHAGPLVDALQATLERNALAEARLRLTVTGGDLNLLQSTGEGGHDPTVLIVAQPPTRYPEAFFERGVMVTIADARTNPLDPFAGHKALSYWNRIRPLQHAGRAGGSEALWFSVTNHLASGCVSNAFLVKDGILLTPFARGEEMSGALPAPVLPGITRGVILELAQERRLPVERRQLSVEDVLGADEVFLTNSSWGVLPVVAVEKEPIGKGAVGEVAKAMREGWLRVVEEETA